MRKILAVLMAMLIAGCGPEPSSDVQVPTMLSGDAVTSIDFELVYDIPSLIGAPKAQIDEMWGAPQCPPKNACVYGEMLEVYFVDEKAANFTLPPTENPRIYGFEVGNPVWSKAGDSRWEVSLNGSMIELSSFNNHYFYVKSEVP